MIHNVKNIQHKELSGRFSCHTLATTIYSIASCPEHFRVFFISVRYEDLTICLHYPSPRYREPNTHKTY